MHMIGAYKKPETAVELGAAVGLFVREELGLTCDEKREDNGVRLVVHVDGAEAADVVVGSYGNVYALSDDESELIEALRARKGTWRPDLISGLRTPTTPAELREWIRLAIDACTPLVVNSERDCGLAVQFEDGGEASFSIVEGCGGIGPTGSFWVHDLRAALWRRPGKTDELLTCEARCMPADEWAAFEKGLTEAGWNAKALDPGRVLAVRITDEHGEGARYNRDLPAAPETVAAVKSVRAWLMEKLEAHDGFDYVELVKGGDGGGVIDFDVITSLSPRTAESVRIKLGDAPER